MKNDKKGFTIIEVVLVLAIGGLIFLMVFIALPALQRSQRNSQRRNDMDRVAAAIIEYQKHNKGKIPFYRQNSYDKNFVPRYLDSTCEFDRTFSNSYLNYYTTTSAHAYKNCSDNFKDPDGTPYAIGLAIGAAQGADRENWLSWSLWGDQPELVGHVIKVATNSACGPKEDSVVYKEGDSNFVVAYILEGGALYCVDNS